MQRQLILLALVTMSLAVLFTACGEESEVSLNGTEWVLTSLNGNDPVEGASFTLAFAEGQLSGKAGCNSYFGDYDQQGNTISMPMIGMTEMYCMDPQGVMDQEGIYLGILSRVNAFSVEGSQLRMIGADSAFLLFEAVE
jgi:heat shock protein HslJ